MAITILQRVETCECLCSQPFYLHKAAQSCLYLLRLVCCISLLNVRVNSIISFKLRYYRIKVVLVFLTGLSAVIVALTPGAQFLLPDSMEEWVYSVLVTFKETLTNYVRKRGMGSSYHWKWRVVHMF